MKLIISNVSGVPIYEQIKQQIKAAILSGDLQAEETLPSLRTLAKDLKISVLTVTKAYTELERRIVQKKVANPSHRKEAAPHGDHTHHFHARQSRQDDCRLPD